MSLKDSAQRARSAARRYPAVRKVAGKVLGRVSPPGAPNPSAWTIKDTPLQTLVDRYQGSFEVPAVSFGTVEDFADSVETMPNLAGANFDMKDLQRCWTIKAVLGTVPPGGKLLEIGAGEPLVAGTLSRIGYDVTVVDPYDGSGNGPREYEVFRAAYSDLRFIREQFPPKDPLPSDFAAVYSISVLEHVPLEAIDAVMSGAAELLGSGGLQIHAVDHVLAGWGADEHLEKLRRIAAGLGLPGERLEAALEQAAVDPETYFVSAEAHNRWRGEVPYDQYPMRRICSVNLRSAG